MKNVKSKHEGLKEEEEGKIQVPEISTGGEITLYPQSGFLPIKIKTEVFSAHFCLSLNFLNQETNINNHSYFIALFSVLHELI